MEMTVGANKMIVGAIIVVAETAASTSLLFAEDRVDTNAAALEVDVKALVVVVVDVLVGVVDVAARQCNAGDDDDEGRGGRRGGSVGKDAGE